MALSISEPNDGGCVDVSNSTVDDGASLITLATRKTFSDGGTPKFWSVTAKISGANGRTPTIDVLAADPFNAVDTLCRHGCYAYDPDGPWLDFASVSHPTAPDRMRFSGTTFTEDEVYFSNYPMYTWARVEADVLAWKASEYVSPTASADADLIIATLPEISNGAAGGNRTCPAANLYGFELTDSTYGGSKNICVLSCGNHPGETPASYAFAAAINFLLSADVRAAFLRKYWRFLCYPNINPQGRYGGLYRNAPDHLTEDHNRIWDDSGEAATVDEIKTAVVADSGAAANIFIDFHSYNFDYGDNSDRLDVSLADADDELSHTAWLVAYRQHEATHNIVEIVNTGNFRGWAKTNLSTASSMKVCFAIEAGSIAAYGVAEYERLGRWLMYVLAHATERGVFPVTAVDDGGRVYFS